MSKKLTIKGITFPNFEDKSKKNFRLIFFVGYTNADGEEAVAVVSKPEERHWQWRNNDKDAFLKPTVEGDSVHLDTIVLKNGDTKKIPAGSNKITEIDGEITDITVQFMDVHDTSLGSLIMKNVVPELMTIWKASGLNPIDMAPLPGGVKVLIKDKVDLEKLANDSQSFLQKKTGDKILHTISVEYNGENPLEIKESAQLSGGKKGTYGVKLGVA